MLALEVRDAIVGLCRQALPKATISTSSVKEIPALWVIIGPIEWTNTDWASIGNRQKEEMISYGVQIEVMRDGKTAEQLEAEAAVCLGILEQTIRANPTLGVFESGQVITALLKPESIKAANLTEGSLAVAKANITATCRTTKEI